MDVEKGLRYFTRGIWEDYVFPTFSPVHFLLLGILVLGVVLIYRNREKLHSRKGKTLARLFLAALLLEQTAQYTWYALAGTFTLGDGLPLYICRMAIPAIILSYLTGNYQARTISVYWGTFGGILALVFPVIYPFYWPHLTNLTYFIGHLVMVWSVVYFVAVDRYRFTRSGLAFVLVFTNLFNYFVYRLNPLVGGNYSYFAYPPVFKMLFGALAPRDYALVVFAIYNLLILLIHWLGTKLAGSVGDGPVPNGSNL